MLLLPSTVIPALGSTIIAPSVAFTLALPRAIVFQATFSWGSSGASVDAYVQTNIGGGSIQWADVAHFAFTTASAVTVAKVMGDTAFVQAAPSDGSLAVGTVNNLLGPLWRVKIVTVGTYAGTSLEIDMVAVE